ncbi:hypothetical protein GA0074692_3854 [Micromonospora pallida]|uniref:Uncharacterized protein n=2 Tax=Micromonospora pallida TaxID=145854 RepID=A0A1C6SYF8_9ACTN|nr:hypothetical protein GA0074692_3854 [Micromonospora pallida]
MTVVQYADISAAGFSPQEDANRRAPRAFWRAAEDLLFSDVVQPPESIRSTVGVPVWSLRHVVVDGAAYWCFAVQGRGGPFGVAGTCRFGFLAADRVHPADAWAQGRKELAAGDPPSRAPDPKAVAAAYRGVLAAVLLGRPVVGIPLDPVDASALIPHVLAALPPSRTRRWSWSTCLLQRPELGGKRVAAGRLPEAMAADAHNLARNLEQMFGAPARDADDALRFGNTAQQFGFDWLVGCAATGRRLDAELQTAELNAPQFLEKIAELHKELTLADVPGLLADAVQQPRLLRVLDLLRRWSKSNLSQALRHVQDNPGSEVRQHLFAFLVESQEGTPEQNLLELPTAGSSHSGWHDELAELLDRHFQADRLAIADFALGLTLPEGIHADLADRRAARGLWLSLGVDHDLDPDTVLFEASADFVVAELAGRQRIPEVALDEIGWLPDPVADVAASLDSSPPAGLRLTAVLAADLVAAVLAPRDPDRVRWDAPDPSPGEALHHLARLLTRAGGSPKWAHDFLAALLAARNIDPQHLQPLAYGILLGYGDMPKAPRPVPRNQLRVLFLHVGLRAGPEWPLSLLAEPPVPRPAVGRAGPPARPSDASLPRHPDQAVPLHHAHHPDHPVSPVYRPDRPVSAGHDPDQTVPSVRHPGQTVPSHHDQYAGAGAETTVSYHPHSQHPHAEPQQAEPGAASWFEKLRWRVRRLRFVGRGGPTSSHDDAPGRRRVSAWLLLVVVVPVALALLAWLIGSPGPDDDPNLPPGTPPATEVPGTQDPTFPERPSRTAEPPSDIRPPWGVQT